MTTESVRASFSPHELGLATRAGKRAARLVTDYYRIAPREWARMRYEIRTLRSLDGHEVADNALAQTLCYSYKKEAGPLLLDEGDIYRICLQDHRILEAARRTKAGLASLLTYVVTHELVHVVRFGQNLQSIELPEDMRAAEERNVENTTWNILANSANSGILHFLSGSRISPGRKE